MNVCTCPDQDTLHDYLLGTLEPADDTAIDEHLEACVSCQAAVDALDARSNAVFARLRQPADTAAEDPALRRLVRQAIALTADTPRVLGNYVLVEPLGAGGMGQVFKAEHRRMKRIVALKLLAPQLVRSPDARARFQREIEAVARLSSPHIVAAFDAGEADGHDFLVMEYVPGCTLAEQVRAGGPLAIDRAIDYTIQAARGLQHAHDAGIIHRDVKPSNILLTSANPQAAVKLLDLGLARLRTENEPLDLTAPDAPMGTAHFMAPEQADNPRAVDARADVYGLGCTLFYLLTGRPPYDGASTMEVLLAHRDRPTPSLAAARPDCPPSLEALFGRLVAKRPEDRPATMRAVIAELALARRAPDTPIVRPVRPPRRSLPALGRLFAASVLLAAFLWALFGQNEVDVGEKPVPAAARSAQAPKPKDAGIEMALIPAGEFWMGASDSDKDAGEAEGPRRKIRMKVPFRMGKTEVTQAQYEQVMGANPSAFGPKGKYAVRIQGKDNGQLPVESVAWLDAVRFCNRLSEREGIDVFYKIDGERVTVKGGTGYRLPTEAEWEYACRAGTATMWHFGESADKLGAYAWYAANSGDVTHPVGTKKANPWGLHDMYGNVPEWCWDRFDQRYYDNVGTSDPVGTSTSTDRAYRGGGWNMLPAQLRTTARRPLGSAYGGPGSFHHIGFRVVRTAEP